MDNAAALILVRLVKATCPAQQLDQYTPDAWAEVLTDIRYEDARLAVVELAKRQTFIAVADIIAEVRRIRRSRITEALRANSDILAVGADPDDVASYLEVMRSDLRAIGDGREVAIALVPIEMAGSPEPIDTRGQRHD